MKDQSFDAKTDLNYAHLTHLKVEVKSNIRVTKIKPINKIPKIHFFTERSLIFLLHFYSETFYCIVTSASIHL